ncbi:hypothetical protein MXB_4349 [Myxobolus squamalis]|nr:hypothetical protein MXB_4349 [Myxobolus squamalis]
MPEEIVDYDTITGSQLPIENAFEGANYDTGTKSYDYMISLQSMMNELNEKRKEDMDIVGNIRKKLTEAVEKIMNHIEQKLTIYYNNTNDEFNKNVQKVLENIEKINKLENDIKSFKGSLYHLIEDNYSDIYKK